TRARRDRVDGHAVPGQFHRGDDREAGDTRLRGAVVGLAWGAVKAGGRGDVDEPAVTGLTGVLGPLAPVPGGVPAEQERAAQVHGDDVIPLLRAHVDQGPVTQDASVV